MLNFTQSRETTADSIKSCDFTDFTLYDGYDWASVQKERGYTAMEECGNWPYNIIVRGVHRENGSYVIKEYTEHDIKTWVYQPTEDGKRQYTFHLDQLRADALDDVDEGSIDGYGYTPAGA